MIQGKEKRGGGALTVEETEITPLLLYTCGVPVSRMMNSGLIKAITPPGRFASVPLRTVDSYPKRDRADSIHSGEFNDLLIEQMKSLGYLQ